MGSSLARGEEGQSARERAGSNRLVWSGGPQYPLRVAGVKYLLPTNVYAAGRGHRPRTQVCGSPAVAAEPQLDQLIAGEVARLGEDAPHHRLEERGGQALEVRVEAILIVLRAELRAGVEPRAIPEAIARVAVAAGVVRVVVRLDSAGDAAWRRGLGDGTRCCDAEALQGQR